MTFRNDASYDAARASSSGGGRGGLIAGGGVGTLVLVGLYLFLGGNPADLLDSGAGVSTGRNTGSYSLDHCRGTAEDANAHDDCRMIATAQTLDEVWAGLLPEQAGLDYTQPALHLFRDTVRTGCGGASSATGPFYCPTDETVYLDVSFFKQLADLGGSAGPLAQMYIEAHEFGHHIQNLEGTLGLSDYRDPGADSNAVKIELQADCYGGIWAHHANAYHGLEAFSQEQLNQAIETAGAVGDDNIQRRSGSEVNPEGFTHGSSREREEAFLRGYESGRMASCDTLGRGAYRS
ncbi:neutral zinc metallopeptidase [Corynebacterium sp. zg-331]|uniref:KPN_02809 family neutral zinc metallopeptidase n=1 Tax=unclassified Corynebacterium TaxID=2624378 RepID=UPI00128D7C48|nr:MULTISPECIES: neutral zinc metallopeptidase [unclassified Corynebacterium]MBC3185462.1 neutral zinc metallopeptidase [Corynebacterium sp. zg-331]MPV51956.1 metalloprotease [Corynebacterium sp. zg331]